MAESSPPDAAAHPDPQPADGDLLTDAVEELYALSPDDFVARRTQLSRAARSTDRTAAQAIAALRRPGQAAWAVNQLMRGRPDLAERLTELGDRLRSAQARLAADDLKSLRTHRDALLAELADGAATAAEAAGRPLTAPVRTEVRDTFVAALADERAEDAVRSAALTRALQYSGFGEVDLLDAVAGPGVRLRLIRGGGPQPDPPRESVTGATASAPDQAAPDRAVTDPAERDRAAQEQRRNDRAERARQAQEALTHSAFRRAETDFASAATALEVARDAADRARDRVAAARAELAAAEAADAEAIAAVSDAVQARARAQAARDHAADAVRALGEPPSR